MSTSPTQTTLIGCGGMARYHIRNMLQQLDTTRITVVCEPSPDEYAATAEVFKQAGQEPPPNQPDLSRLLTDYAASLDTAFIITPHAYHHDQTQACLEAGLDVLLEKPMVMNTAEARSLIEIRDRTQKLLVVAFPGSLSSGIRTAVSLLRSGKLGTIKGLTAAVWQDWGVRTVGTWRQQPEIAGGGFLFDTGAHMLNTVADLAGEEFVEVAAWLENYGRPVDTLAAVIGRLASGAFVTLNACGEAMPSVCSSDIRVFCSQAILHTGIWGEHLKVQMTGKKKPRTIKVPASMNVWQQFLAMRNGQLDNPCPPEVGLRMARLWEAIQASAAQQGQPVRCN